MAQVNSRQWLKRSTILFYDSFSAGSSWPRTGPGIGYALFRPMN